MMAGVRRNPLMKLLPQIPMVYPSPNLHAAEGDIFSIPL
jgi:hypothetical protein